MLKDFISILQKDSKLDEAFQFSHEMLRLSGEMFDLARKSLRHSDTNVVDRAVIEMDKKINKYERKTRKDVLQHLAIAGPEHLASGLVLVSIIIDFERIGDYAKNIVQLAENHPGKLTAGSAEADLQRIEDAVAESFSRLEEILKVNDSEKAEAFIQDYSWINPLCDRMVERYIRAEDKDLSQTDLVALALYFRYLKRVFSHLRNVATAVYRPFHKMGFVQSKYKQEEMDDE